MRMRTKLVVTGGATLLILGAAGVATATVGGDDDATERRITGTELDRASEAALEHAGGGEVTDTEVGDEEGYYEVEVTRADGSQVDVHLDEGFAVLGTEDEAQPDDD